LQNLLYTYLEQALHHKASDLHFSATSSGMTVLIRQNGTFSKHTDLTLHEAKTITSLLKLHAQMDISLSRVPQDGRIQFDYQTIKTDVRVSSLPTLHGEDFVCRFFDSKKGYDTLSDLGFTPTAASLVESLLKQNSGLILVTGATGSGKTTTLYTCLSYILRHFQKNIITLEDPIEMELPGIRQSQINPGIGYGFVQGLKACLRQDPDVLMLGEIRDEDTAKTALEAAYTGHLVLATLHTQDCRSSLLRLKGFNLDPFWIQYALIGVISQTLINGKQGRLPLTEILIPSHNFEQDANILDTSQAQHYYGWNDDISAKKQLGLIEHHYEYVC
jgi:type II secretory ATPase GspE/PulE/Tfp pilus assembly ATPase PilB-like protein